MSQRNYIDILLTCFRKYVLKEIMFKASERQVLIYLAGNQNIDTEGITFYFLTKKFKIAMQIST